MWPRPLVMHQMMIVGGAGSGRGGKCKGFWKRRQKLDRDGESSGRVRRETGNVRKDHGRDGGCRGGSEKGGKCEGRVPRMVSICSVVLVLLLDSVDACDKELLEACLGGLMLPGLYERFLNESIFPVYDDVTLQNICSRVSSNDSTHCVQSVARRCSNAIELRIFEGSVLATNYLCGQGRPAYERQRQCFARSDFIQSGTQCYSVYDDRLREMTLDNYGKAHKAAAAGLICRHIDEFIDCLRAAARDVCGSEAGDWIHAAKTINFVPTKRQMKCTELQERINPSIVLAGFGCVVLLVIVIIIGTIAVYRRSRPLNQRGHLLIAPSRTAASLSGAGSAAAAAGKRGANGYRADSPQPPARGGTAAVAGRGRPPKKPRSFGGATNGAAGNGKGKGCNGSFVPLTEIQSEGAQFAAVSESFPDSGKLTDASSLTRQ